VTGIGGGGVCVQQTQAKEMYHRPRAGGIWKEVVLEKYKVFARSSIVSFAVVLWIPRQLYARSGL
jgi:hypothetical protein